MSQKSLNVKKEIHKKIFSYLRENKILKIYKEFESSIVVKDRLAVAVSGGPDSLSLAFLVKCFALKNKIVVKYFIVDHKLRKESSEEAKIVINILKKIDIDCKILRWNGKKPFKNIQSIARDKRYQLLIKECKRNKIKNILFAHHQDDLLENFLIRILRGSGLNGLVSFGKQAQYRNSDIRILRPLMDLEKKDLNYLSKRVFNFFIKDPSNQDTKFKRIRIRNLLAVLAKEGFDKKKFLLTINNLKDSDKTIRFYVEQNIKKNSFFFKSKNLLILNKLFFDQSHETIFRSLTKTIQMIGIKQYPVRGKSINELIKKLELGSFKKVTLGGCFIEKVKESVLITKEN